VRQVVDTSLEWPLPVVDLREVPDPWADARSWMDAELRRPVDLSRGPAFAISLLRLADDHLLLYFCAHHVVIDGYGFSLIVQRIAEIYSALEAGLDCPPSPLGSLRMLVENELSYRASERFRGDRQYWIDTLYHPPPVP